MQVQDCEKRRWQHLERILNFFDHRLTNGPIEELNNKVQGRVKKACDPRRHRPGSGR
jgi:transposase